jgi:uncharacterized protein involved in oxidation of intracellular sulfur
MSKVLFVLHDPPYGNERTYNGLRWALAQAESGEQVRLFLFGDSVVAAAEDQQVPNGYYNTGKQIVLLLRKGGAVALCGSCMDARGMSEERSIEGTHRSNMDELSEWTRWADQVISV